MSFLNIPKINALKSALDSTKIILDGLPSVNVDSFFRPGDPAGNYTNAFERASIAMAAKGGGIITVSGVRDTDYIKLRTGVHYKGVSLGDRLGTIGSVIRARAGTTSPNFIYRDDNQVRCWGIHDLIIDGNKSQNATLKGLYLYQADDGISLSNDKNLYAYIQRCVFRQFGGDIWTVDGAGTGSGGLYFNIRNIWAQDVTIRTTDGIGMNLNKLTDSVLRHVVVSQCAGGGANLVNCSNTHLIETKGFYNNQSSSLSGAFRFSGCHRCRVIHEAQEEYTRGVYISDCDDMDMFILADACGLPATASVEGAFVRNTWNSFIKIVATSYSSPTFKQSRPLTVAATASESLAGLRMEVLSQKQTTSAITYQVENGADLTGFTTTFNGVAANFGFGPFDTFSPVPANASGAPYLTTTPAWSNKITGDATTGLSFDWDVTSPVAGPHNFRLFRNTTKPGGGSAALIVYSADGTSTISHQFSAGSNARLCISSSTVAYNSAHIEFGPYHIFADSSGRLYSKNGTPTSTTDGSQFMQTVAVPASATATGVAGTYAYDANYLYVCVATNTWKRTALTTW